MAIQRQIGTPVLNVVEGEVFIIDSELHADNSYTLRSLDGKSITVADADDLIPAP
jgi:hypothetical protein